MKCKGPCIKCWESDTREDTLLSHAAHGLVWSGEERDKSKDNHGALSASVLGPWEHSREALNLSSGKNKPRGRWDGISELCKRWWNEKRVAKAGRGFQAEEVACGPEGRRASSVEVTEVNSRGQSLKVTSGYAAQVTSQEELQTLN